MIYEENPIKLLSMRDYYGFAMRNMKFNFKNMKMKKLINSKVIVDRKIITKIKKVRILTIDINNMISL